MDAESQSRELLKRVRQAVALASRASTAESAGAYRSTFRGSGLDFAELDEYRPGDEVRHIDWNASARAGRPFVRRFHEEREGHVLLVVDRSHRMHFGSRDTLKVQTAAVVAAVVAILAVRNRDRVGLLTFGEDDPLSLAPTKGLQRAIRVVREVLTPRSVSDSTQSDLTEALERASRLARRRALIIVIGDFLQAEGLETLTRLNNRHELLCVAVRDDLEWELPAAGLVQIEGVGLVDSSDGRLRRRYAKRRTEQMAEVRTQLAKAGVDGLELRAGEDPVAPLLNWLQGRARRQRGWA
ncbi:MAG: DUF58 domain-containing protein [Myxococcota bacterium]|jgi:uncharacterized protein (DUF58 family)|nr:DUF58 domain-containing protein [Myxococcota bacterium]